MAMDRLCPTCSSHYLACAATCAAAVCRARNSLLPLSLCEGSRLGPLAAAAALVAAGFLQLYRQCLQCCAAICMTAV